ncbi:helix-turn-helix domain-containing protein [Streptomyces sp. NPDC048172]|uniref:helix-turn-helix domain-containing protein n=1 Tax=Streptomyces sp. NPDC048172 TaxID=3365505 RepID=UPI00371CACFC
MDVRPELREACRAAGIGVVAASEYAGPPRVHLALPSLSARLVVSLGDPVEVEYGGRTERRAAVVAGLMRPGVATASQTLRPGQPMVYVDLSLPAMQRLTGVPPGEVDAGGVSAEALLPWVGLLTEELAEQPPEGRAALMRVRLLERLRRAGPVDVPRDAVETMRLIGACQGRVPVDELARRAHLSPRQLRHVMGRALGVGPKFASRVARLSAAVDRAGAGAESWAQVAAECAYHDQSHLVRDFTALMRTTPTAWLAEEGRDLGGWRRPAP